MLFRSAAGALIRLSFALRHKALVEERRVPWHFAAIGCVILGVVAVALAPSPQPVVATAPVPRFAEVQAIVTQRCVSCHGPALQSKNVRLDSAAEISKHAQAIYQQVVVLKQMPMNNATAITEAERAAIGRWFSAGAVVE